MKFAIFELLAVGMLAVGSFAMSRFFFWCLERLVAWQDRQVLADAGRPGET